MQKGIDYVGITVSYMCHDFELRNSSKACLF